MNTLFGKPLQHWADIDGVMSVYNIKDARELQAAIKGPPKDPKADWVPIYDKGNKDRLLGYLMKRHAIKGGRSLRIAVMVEPFRPYSTRLDLTAFDIESVEFEFDWLYDLAAYSAKMIYVTSNKLETLLKLRDFALPGESSEQVKERLMMRGVI
jgi:hypothetical protein